MGIQAFSSKNLPGYLQSILVELVIAHRHLSFLTAERFVGAKKLSLVSDWRELLS